MATGVKAWSTTSADNDDSDSNINYLEGQAPSTVNDSARAMMAAIASWRDLIGYGTVSAGTVGGTGNAVTLTCSPTVEARTSGRRYAFIAGAGNTSGVTLTVDSTTAGAIQYRGAALVSGDIAASDAIVVRDDGTNFQMVTPPRLSVFTGINGTTAKSAIAASDKFPITDSAASDIPKHILWSSIIATQAIMETATSIISAVTPGRMQYHPGVAKAWVNFTTRATNAACTVNASHNVDGVSRTASGVYLVTFTTDFSSVNYAVSAISEAVIGLNLLTTFDNMAAGTCEIIQQSASAGTATNSGEITALFFGDQA